VATALVARGHDSATIRGVLQVMGGTSISLQDVEALVADARRERERDARPGENFSVTRHERSY
jgi:hypothetical protein